MAPAAVHGDPPARGLAHGRLQSFPQPLREGIRCEDVWFTYPGSDRPALAGISCEIAAGQKVALVGENGAGKTTLAKLLLGLYRPDTGRITFDGCDVQQIDPWSLRRAMSAVSQQFVRYQLTLGENVGLGRPDRVEDRASLEEAGERAGIGDLVRALPAGYETLLGPDVGGVDLSGGQWQRVAIARAFFRDAAVLVLDEPTAALDPLAELAVFERFAELAQGRTALLISHRLGMARLADRVLVLAHGRVVEQGTHEELLRAEGAYATLFRAQARWYRASRPWASAPGSQ
jgi:ATP-binding cassette subfamily B protein